MLLLNIFLCNFRNPFQHHCYGWAVILQVGQLSFSMVSSNIWVLMAHRHLLLWSHLNKWKYSWSFINDPLSVLNCVMNCCYKSQNKHATTLTGDSFLSQRRMLIWLFLCIVFSQSRNWKQIILIYIHTRTFTKLVALWHTSLWEVMNSIKIEISQLSSHLAAPFCKLCGRFWLRYCVDLRSNMNYPIFFNSKYWESFFLLHSSFPLIW